jgi:mycofactocin system glycosyltransferase
MTEHSQTVTERFTLDASCRRLDGDRILLGGSPLSLFKLGPAGQRVVDALEQGHPLPRGHEPLTNRLLDAGAIHPVVSAEPGVGPTAADVTLVVPAFAADPDRLARIVAATAARVAIVVDDASPDPLGPVAGATVVRRVNNGGPAAARTTGLDLVATPYVAFVDADVTVEPHWLESLLPHLRDPKVALVAPRVQAAAAGGRLARFDALHSPLDLGDQPARIRAGTRVSYVPAAAIVARCDAVRAVGGFDPALRVGEDVDLVWRLVETGWRGRYEPRVVVHHDVRPTVTAWLRQRYRYGTSAAPLATRHPGALAPVQVSAWSAAAWTLPAAGAPLAGVAVAAGSAAALTAKLPPMTNRGREALRLAGLGHLHAGRMLAGGVTRAWWPIAIVAASASSRARKAVLAAALVPALTSWRTVRSTIDPASYVALRVLDDVSYGAGLWVGAWRERTLAPLRPDFTSWPQPRRYDRAR